MEEETVLDILKIVFMVGFVAIVIIVGSIPIRMKTFKTNKFLKTMGTTFAGSVFLNVSILHILPESADTI
jgi:zinc transporter 1/2/3